MSNDVREKISGSVFFWNTQGTCFFFFFCCRGIISFFVQVRPKKGNKKIIIKKNDEKIFYLLIFLNYQTSARVAFTTFEKVLWDVEGDGPA